VRSQWLIWGCLWGAEGGREQPWCCSRHPACCPKAHHPPEPTPLTRTLASNRCNQEGEDQQEVWRDIAAVLRESLLALEARAPPNPNQLEERPELRRIIAERCRRSKSRGVDKSDSISDGKSADGNSADGNGSSSSTPMSRSSSSSSSSGRVGGQERLSLAAAAAALAQPCQTFHVWCNVLAQPAWSPDQQRRQLLSARQGPVLCEHRGAVGEQQLLAAWKQGQEQAPQQEESLTATTPQQPFEEPVASPVAPVVVAAAPPPAAAAAPAAAPRQSWWLWRAPVAVAKTLPTQ